MNKFGRWLYRYKIPVFNTLLAVFVFLYPPNGFSDLVDSGAIANREDLHYYLGVAILLGLFFEIAGIFYKTHFIYARESARKREVPWHFQLAFFPRLLITAGLITLAFRGMGLLEKTDFILLIIVAFAVWKEFYVRSTLMNPESTEGQRINKTRVWMGEIFLFVYSCLSYIAFWEFFIMETPRLWARMKYPQNYPWFALAFLFALLMFQIPNFLEEHFREKPTREKWYSWFTMLLPLFGFMLYVFLIGKKMGLPY